MDKFVSRKRTHSPSKSQSPSPEVSSEKTSNKRFKIIDESALADITKYQEKLPQEVSKEDKPNSLVLDNSEEVKYSCVNNAETNSGIENESDSLKTEKNDNISSNNETEDSSVTVKLEEKSASEITTIELEKCSDSDNTSVTGDNDNKDQLLDDSIQISSDNEDDSKQENVATAEKTPSKKPKLDSKNLTPKQQQRKVELEQKQQQKKLELEKKQQEKEEKLKKKQEEKERTLQEKLKQKELKEKEIERKKKEKEEKEEKKRKEREEKEQKRKEKEEKEEVKRKEREQEKQKKLQEIEEKKKEKIKEEEKKQKAAAAFVNFFVPKKSDELQDEKKTQNCNFLQFEVKSDMKLPLPRRNILSQDEKEKLEEYLEEQDTSASYLKDLKSGKTIGKSFKTWPYEENNEDEVVIVDLGQTICEDQDSLQKYKAKFLYFHENRRPAYYGTWRKTSKNITARKPFSEDKSLLNYDEDSDDDWEEEEQGESLNGSEDEAEKEPEDDYEVDNEFFVPHGHLSEDEIDDEEISRLSPESQKQKLKLLKEAFDEDMQSKTHKLKPRAIGCIWYNKDGSNVEEAVDRYLQPLAMITTHCQIIIKSRIDIPGLMTDKRPKIIKEIDPEIISSFLKTLHGNSNKKSVLIDQFLTDLKKEGNSVTITKRLLERKIKECAVWEKYREKESKKYKFHWVVNEGVRAKYDWAE